MPAASVFVEGKTALNKLMFLPNGQQLCVGDSKGQLWLYDLNESIVNPKNDDWTKLSRQLLEIQQQNTEAEELSHAMNLGNASSTNPIR